MINEVMFICHSALTASLALLFLWSGKEALTAGVCLFSILSNLLVTKQMMLFGFETICTDVFTIGAVFCLNLLQEYFGKQAATKAIACNFIMLLVYLGMCQLHLAYQANSFDTMQPHFLAILSPMFKLIIVSVVSYVLSQILDTFLYAKLKQLSNGKYVVLRNITSSACTQFFDTVFFSVFALYGTVHSLWHVIIVSFSIKMIVILCCSPFIAFSKFLLGSTTNHE